MLKKAIAIAVVASVIGMFIFLPQILSTTVGKRFFTHMIEEKTGGKADIKSLHLSWFGPQEAKGITLKGKGYEGSFDRIQAKIALWKFVELFNPENLFGFKGNLKVEGGHFHFQEGEMEATVEGISASFLLHENAADFTASGQSMLGGQKGSLSLEGRFGPSRSFSVRGEISSFPTLALAHFLEINHKVDRKALLEIIGSTFSLKGFATMQDGEGSCDLSFNSPNASTQVRGHLEDNLFTLTEPLLGTIRLTPLLAQKILQGINPMFVTGISSDNPIQFRFETRKFRLFLEKSFKWHNLQVGAAMIDVGKIRCTNGETLAALIGLLKSSPLKRTREMEVWFTPVYFKIENGMLQAGRMDALAANSVRFCTWGTINLVNEKLNMILGLNSETLKRVFGLKMITHEYVLKIPITGSIQKPKLAVGTAAAKIAALVAAEHTQGSKGLLNLFLQPDTDVPKPNTPFPWDMTRSRR